MGILHNRGNDDDDNVRRFQIGLLVNVSIQPSRVTQMM